MPRNPLSYFLIAAISIVTISTAPRPSIAADEPATRPVPEVLATYKMGRWAERLDIPVNHGGRREYFFLDTNCSVSILDSSEFPKLNTVASNLTMRTPGGDRGIDLYDPPSLIAGPFSLDRCGPVTKVDLSNVRAVTGQEIIGALGLSAVRNHVVQLDSENHEFRFIRPDFSSHEEWGTKFPLHISENFPSPIVKMSLQHAEKEIQLDTGFDGFLSLPTGMFNQLRSSICANAVSVPIVTANGIAEVQEMRLSNLELAGQLFHGVIVDETLDKSPTVGLDFLERFAVTFDFPDHLMQLIPGKEIDHLTESNMSGMHVGRWSGKLIAKVVDDKSPASSAGIQSEDVIISLNRKAEKQYEMWDIQELLRSGDGREITVELEHAGVRRMVKFKLRREI